MDRFLPIRGGADLIGLARSDRLFRRKGRAGLGDTVVQATRSKINAGVVYTDLLNWPNTVLCSIRKMIFCCSSLLKIIILHETGSVPKTDQRGTWET